MEAIRLLAERGAIWRPSGSIEMNSERRVLLKCGPDVTIELLKILVSHRAAAEETLRELFSSRRLRDHLSGESWWLSRLKLTGLLVASAGG